MRSFFSRDRNNKDSSRQTASSRTEAPAPNNAITTTSTATPTTTPDVPIAIPRVLRQRVNQRLLEISEEQEREKMIMATAISLGDRSGSEDSENSLILQNDNSTIDEGNNTYNRNDLSEDDEKDNHNNIISNNNTLHNPFLSTSSPPTIRSQTNPNHHHHHNNVDESSRLLQSIGSDLSESGYFEEDDIRSVSSSLSPSLMAKSRDVPPSLLDGQQVSLSQAKPQSNNLSSSKEIDQAKNHVKSNERVLSPAALFRTMTEWCSLILDSKIFSLTMLILLTVCLIGQLVLVPTEWAVWSTTGLSMLCSTFLWPTRPKISSSSTRTEALKLRRQELLAQGLPFKSRLLVAQSQIRNLERRIRVLKQLEEARKSFLVHQQEQAVLLTTQVLLKSNKAKCTTHLNALALSVLPTKLATIGVEVQMPVIWALAQSKRGSRYILIQLFRELLADQSNMFRYPPILTKKKKNTTKSRKKSTTKTSKRNSINAMSEPRRLEEI